MPIQINSLSTNRWSGRQKTACRTAFFLGLGFFILLQPAGAQDFSNAAPGSFVGSTQKNTASHVVQSQSPPPMQQNQSADQPYLGQPTDNGNNNNTYQGSASIGVTAPQSPQPMPIQQMQQPIQQQQMQQPMQPPPQQQSQTQQVFVPQNQQPATASAQPDPSLPADFPTLNELKQSFAQPGNNNQNVQTAQAQSNNNNGGGTAGGVGAGLLKAIGSMAAPIAMGARPMGMGMGYPGMGMGGMGMPMGMGGMGMGIPGMGMGMGGMGMGIPGMGMGMGGMGMPMGMGMSPFASPKQMMMNSLINQGLYQGAQMFKNH